ncbi:MAG: alkaline phosphatase [Elusimicrobia bacterium]|nr:MAG: alkaline phosphatase [Elusimicrobiota bacterium]
MELDAAVGAAPEVTVCGRPAAEAFGKAPTFIPSEAGVGKPALRAEGVFLSTAGPCAVTVAGGPSAAWTVYAVPKKPRAKNVILLIGDGMSLAHRTAARAMRGHSSGRAKAPLAMDDMPHTALVGTSASDSLLPDSAQTATAYSLGLKTAVESVGVMADRTEDAFDDPKAEHLLALARRKGLATGIVTTAALVDATPAAFFAHTRWREKYAEIGAQLPLEAPEVALGGGAAALAPKSVGAMRAAGWEYAADAKTLTERAAAPGTKKLLGVFERGFVLMAEGALIDKYSHQLDWERAVLDTLEFDMAVARAKAFAAKDGNTLVLVVSDHTHGASVSGMVRDDLPGPLMRDKVGTYDYAGYPDYKDADGDGYPDRLDVPKRLAFFFSAYPDHYETWGPKLDAPFDPAKKAGKGLYAANEAYKSVPGAVLREGNIPRVFDSGVHSAEDVILTGMGPGSERVKGWLENTEVFRIMAEALSLGAP